MAAPSLQPLNPDQAMLHTVYRLDANHERDHINTFFLFRNIKPVAPQLELPHLAQATVMQGPKQMRLRGFRLQEARTAISAADIDKVAIKLTETTARKYGVRLPGEQRLLNHMWAVFNRAKNDTENRFRMEAFAVVGQTWMGLAVTNKPHKLPLPSKAQNAWMWDARKGNMKGAVEASIVAPSKSLTLTLRKWLHMEMPVEQKLSLGDRVQDLSVEVNEDIVDPILSDVTLQKAVQQYLRIVFYGMLQYLKIHQSQDVIVKYFQDQSLWKVENSLCKRLTKMLEVDRQSLVMKVNVSIGHLKKEQPEEEIAALGVALESLRDNFLMDPFKSCNEPRPLAPLTQIAPTIPSSPVINIGR